MTRMLRDRERDPIQGRVKSRGMSHTADLSPGKATPATPGLPRGKHGE